jgi:hypothetical protein
MNAKSRTINQSKIETPNTKTPDLSHAALRSRPTQSQLLAHNNSAFNHAEERIELSSLNSSNGRLKMNDKGSPYVEDINAPAIDEMFSSFNRRVEHRNPVSNPGSKQYNEESMEKGNTDSRYHGDSLIKSKSKNRNRTSNFNEVRTEHHFGKHEKMNNPEPDYDSLEKRN